MSVVSLSFLVHSFLLWICFITYMKKKYIQRLNSLLQLHINKSRTYFEHMTPCSEFPFHLSHFLPFQIQCCIANVTSGCNQTTITKLQTFCMVYGIGSMTIEYMSDFIERKPLVIPIIIATWYLYIVWK